MSITTPEQLIEMLEAATDPLELISLQLFAMCQASAESQAKDDADTLLILQGLQVMDLRLQAIEAKIAEYEPLIELVRSKVDRGASWRKRKGSEDG